MADISELTDSVFELLTASNISDADADALLELFERIEAAALLKDAKIKTLSDELNARMPPYKKEHNTPDWIIERDLIRQKQKRLLLKTKENKKKMKKRLSLEFIHADNLIQTTCLNMKASGRN